MAETEITQMLVNLIPQGGFAGFLFYLFNSVKKELADHRQEAKKEETEIRKQYREEKEALRARYDVVISDLQREKEGFRTTLQDKITALNDRLNTLENKLIELSTRLENILEKIADLKDR
jgi:DNA anti-recombination protein RmuC